MSLRPATLILTGLVACAAPDVVAEPQAVALFDGASLSGWDCFLVDDGAVIEDVWSVEDGVLICRGEPGGYLRSMGEYQDFRLVVEWRWPEEPGNSGVLLRIGGDEEQMLPPSAEAQLRHGSAGDMYGFQDFRIGGDEDRLSEIGLPGWKLARISDAEHPAGEWNRYEITVLGGEIVVELNGVEVNRATDCAIRSGNIGLQSEGGVIHFRRVELTPVDLDLRSSHDSRGASVIRWD